MPQILAKKYYATKFRHPNAIRMVLPPIYQKICIMLCNRECLEHVVSLERLVVVEIVVSLVRLDLRVRRGHRERGEGRVFREKLVLEEREVSSVTASP